MSSNRPCRALKNNTLLLLSVSMLGLLIVACGGDDPGQAAAPTVQPTAAPAPTSTPEPIVQVVEDPVVPAVEPAPGSREAQVFAVFEEQIKAINNRDWEGFISLCVPGANPLTSEALAFAFETSGVRDDPLPKDVELEGFNWRNATVKFYGDDTAVTGGDIYSHDEFVVSGASDLWARVDGEWYSETALCIQRRH